MKAAWFYSKSFCARGGFSPLDKAAASEAQTATAEAIAKPTADGQTVSRQRTGTFSEIPSSPAPGLLQ